MAKVSRWTLIIATALMVVALLAAAALYAFLKFSVLPLREGHRLANGAVTTLIPDTFGPVAIGAYLIRLNEGFALIDCGSSADGIRQALARQSRAPNDIRAIFITHGHGDHYGGIGAFPSAAVYVLAADADAVRRAQPLQDAAVINVSGTQFEVFALPGHTPGSAAILVHGVLFVGDSAAAAHDGSFQPNTMMGLDTEQTVRSLRALAHRLRPRRAEINAVAFGHQGSLDGGAFLRWAGP